MHSNSTFSKYFSENISIVPTPDEKSSYFEKYTSLINSLKGFEEYILDKSGFIISSNLESVTITGYEEWEVIGKHISIFYSLEDQLAGKPHDDLEKAEKRSPLFFTGLRRKKRNSTFWAKIKLKTLIEKEHVVGYKMTLQDATHKAISDHRVKGFRDEYLSLFNNSFVGIFKFSMNDYSILMMNEKADKLTGIESNDGKKEGFHKIFDRQEDFLYLITHLKTHKRLEEWEVKLKHQDTWVIISCRYFQQKNFVEGVIMDTTALKRSSHELNRLKNELDQFIYHASHELRSPLVSMLGIINLVNAEKNLPDSTLHLNNILREKVHYLDELLKNITSIAYNNKGYITPEGIEWESLIKSVLKELTHGVTNHIQVFYNIEQNETFTSDIARIRTIIRNLISNSFRYHNPIADNPCVNIKIRTDATKAVITIADNGIGIDPKYVNDIFKMFYKATEFPKGPGLGLYITKAMTEKLGGSINVESSVGIGTIFSVSIPNDLDKK